ncbi:hypothetical protein [Streptosporangium roseum]|uniref:GIY-YIG domain-containing protein n=1 Tax=Streptosporangium roseum (strain ATCC 12428 / DSM 43021 / JCM 3005 / KCTC 9067 / NCIMB 10171 / NRRL 2505 / NI 9100) TaxID=479432 RepID=D2AXF8_STRRD|nr:hypothetical protein [Streptosporangium roseum]ACZ83138.1 hypothetical protein Sros_0082 [Streptosporangium roseum DSM 43021]
MGRDLVELRIRGGELTDSGSWIYVWLLEGRVIYIGTTGLPPEVRTWLHLHDPDPDIGRVKARYPGIGTDSLDVVAFRLPESMPRSEVKVAVIAHLSAMGLLSEHYVGDPPQRTSIGDGLSSLVLLITRRIGQPETG